MSPGAKGSGRGKVVLDVDVPYEADGTMSKRSRGFVNMTLDQIENQVIRPRFHDPRVHAALNCGARSCPPLHGHAFTEANLERNLTSMMQRMVRNTRI